MIAIPIQHGKERGRMMSSRITHTINTHGRRKTSPALTYVDIDANKSKHLRCTVPDILPQSQSCTKVP